MGKQRDFVEIRAHDESGDPPKPVKWVQNGFWENGGPMRPEGLSRGPKGLYELKIGTNLAWEVLPVGRAKVGTSETPYGNHGVGKEPNFGKK